MYSSYDYLCVCLFLVGNSRKFETQLSQPYEETLLSSTHSDDIGGGGKEAADAEYSILLMECLRVLIEGVCVRVCARACV